MGRKSNSPGSPIANVHQLAFPSEACSACPLRNGCDLRGTSLQCTSIPILGGDIQPETPDAHLWMDRLGHDLAVGAQGHFASLRLPQAIPRLTRQKAAGVAAQGLQWVAVGLGHVLLEGPKRVLPKSKFVGSTGLDPRTKLALVMTGEDDAMARLGNEPSGLIAAVARAGYDLVLAPAFSVWDGHSGLHNRLQIVFCDQYASALADAGIPTVYPAVWYRHADMYEVAVAIQLNPSIRLAWLDFQTVSHGRSWARALDELDEFARLVPDVGLIVYGVGEHRRPDLWKRDHVVCVISSGEFISAVRQNRGPEAGLAARERIHSFVSEPHRHRPRWKFPD